MFTGTSNLVIGYHALAAISPIRSKDDDIVVLKQLYNSSFCQSYHIVLNQKIVECMMIFGTYVDRCYMDGNEYGKHDIDRVEHAIAQYRIMFPKWFHLYKYFVTINTI